MTVRFFKNRTNNHLNWVMVDATDFATPESALSAATKIKIYGQLRGAAGTNFVSSGTGSLTNDITHVGASATGIYHIALVKADLSDASAAWYDTYVINLSATGAAYQTLIAEGCQTDDSYVSNVLSYLSNVVSYMSNMQSNLSAAHSDTYSQAVQTNSRVLLVQSRLSDLDSRLVSDISDVLSQTRGQSDYLSHLRSFLVVLSGAVSDTYSAAVLAQAINASDMSDLRSAIAAGPAATITASDISDIASAVRAALVSDLSDILSAARGNSDAISHVRSHLTLFDSSLSDILSGVTVLQSRVAAAVATASDVASQVWAQKYTAAGNVGASTFGSALRLNMSRISDLQSFASDFMSDFQSRVPKLVANNSQVSDLASDLKSYLTVMSGVQSDIYSQLSDFRSDVASLLNTTGIQLNASTMSDLRSAIAGGPAATVTASDISDIASAVWAVALATRTVTLNASDMSDIRSAIAAIPAVTVTASDISDIASAVRATMVSDLSDILSAAVQANSRVRLVQSQLSDLDSRLVSDHSDVMSALTVVESMASDAASAAQQANSRALVLQSAVSDLDSALASDYSDIKSQLAIVQSMASDAASAAQQGNSRTILVQSRLSDLDSRLSSDFSDLQSHLTLIESEISDLDSALSSQFTANAALFSDVKSAALVAASYASDVYSALTTVRAEPGQGNPAASLNALAKMDYIYKAWRNKKVNDGVKNLLYNDAGTIVDHKATTTSAGGSVTVGLWTTGP